MTMSKLTDKYTIKRNKIRNQITLLRGQAEEGVAFFLDKVEETINACDNLLLTWRTHGTPLGDRKVKETMHKTVTRILEQIEQWRDNSSTDDTLTSIHWRNPRDEPRYSKRGRRCRHRISFHTETADQED